MAVDTAQQQPYNPVVALTRYINQCNKPTAREQKEKLTPEGHNTLRLKLNAEGPLAQRDIATTKENINGITKKFQRYVLYPSGNPKDPNQN